MPKLSDLISIRLGAEELNAVYLGGQKLWPAEGDVSIVGASYITPIQSENFRHTTEDDQELVVLRTNANEKIQGVTAVASRGINVFLVGEPFYLGDGTYAFPVAKTDPYGGYGHPGNGQDSIVVTVPGARGALTIPATNVVDTDHDPYPRFRAPIGFCHIALIPYGGVAYTKDIFGFAYNAHRLDVNGAECDIYRLTDMGSEIPERKYVLASHTEFPANTGSMATAAFGTVNRGTTSISITVPQNPGSSPRVGYVEMVSSHYDADNSAWSEDDVRMRNILLQDGATKRFGYIGKSASFTNITTGNFSRVFVLDLDELEGGDVTLSKQLDAKLFFLAGIESEIDVFLDDNTTPVGYTIIPGSPFVRYNLNNGIHTIKIKKKTV